MPRHETRKPLFTKRHYVAIASKLRQTNRFAITGRLGEGAEDTISAVADDLGDLFEDDNPRFDRIAFYEAIERKD